MYDSILNKKYIFHFGEATLNRGLNLSPLGVVNFLVNFLPQHLNNISKADASFEAKKEHTALTLNSSSEQIK